MGKDYCNGLMDKNEKPAPQTLKPKGIKRDERFGNERSDSKWQTQSTQKPKKED